MRILDKNRASYKKKFADKDQCVFCCDVETLECEGLRGQFWKVIVNRFPYMDGNVMIVPIRHIEKIADIDLEEWQEFQQVLVRTQKILGSIFETNSFNIGMNMGEQSGASIAHLHWQIVPRKFKNITVLNTFADLYVVAVTPEETKRLIDKKIKK
jgi:ATP adenylyltransferase